MAGRNSREQLSETGIVAYLQRRNGELLDAVITAAAIVAEADGSADPVERRQLLVFLNRSGLLAIVTRDEVLDSFEDRVRQVRDRRGFEMAMRSLERLAGRPLARLALDAGADVAAADGHLHPGELQRLALICSVLGFAAGPAPHRKNL
jgi:tellurite resistance protein